MRARPRSDEREERGDEMRAVEVQTHDTNRETFSDGDKVLR